MPDLIKNPLYDSAIYLLFNLEEECICTRRLTAKPFYNAKSLAAYLGCRLPTLFESIRTRRHIKSKYNEREYAVRILNTQKIENELWETQT